MSRPPKTGVEFWRFDTDFFQDKTIRLIQGEYGVKGVYITIYILNEIYRTGGYYKEWDDDDCLLASIAMGSAGDCSANLIRDVVAGLVRRAYFDKGVFDSFHVLTSAEIQRRFLQMVGRSRDVIFITTEYFLLDLGNPADVPETVRPKLNFRPIHVSRTETPISRTETPVSPAGNPQKKGKEKKGKQRKGKKGEEEAAPSAPPPPPPPKQTRRMRGHYHHVPLSDEEVEQLRQKLGDEEAKRCILYVDEYVQMYGNKSKWKDFYLVCLKCSRERWGLRDDRAAPPRNPAQGRNPDADPFDAAAKRLEDAL